MKDKPDFGKDWIRIGFRKDRDLEERKEVEGVVKEIIWIT